MTRNVAVEAHVLMEYPKETEIIDSRRYTLRFAASDETQMVEVSIDGGPWQECRKAGQYFWYDWARYLSGRHEIVARARLFTGKTESTQTRRVRVSLEEGARAEG
jgi:hypothetical protein